MSNREKKYKKWNKYKIGDVSFIETRKNYPHRKMFVDYVVKNFDSVIEIGPGEMLEYADVKELKPTINYTIVDVSSLFLENCVKKYSEVKVIQSPIEELELNDQFDIVYASSVLEHMKNIKKALNNMIKLANNFYFVMFKWNYEGDLKSTYIKRKKYWSSSFNIWMLLDHIKSIANIEECCLVKTDTGEKIDFEKYSVGLSGPHRTADYLVIQGKKI